MINIADMMKKAQEMQSKMGKMSEQLANIEIEGSAGGGMVKITLNGKGEAKKVSLDSSLIKPEEGEIIEDLTVAAFNDAKAKLENKVKEEMNKVTDSLGLPPGMPNLF